MTKRPLPFILPLLAMVVLACGSESALVPDVDAPVVPPAAPVPVLTTLQVEPTTVLLTPGVTQQLTIAAWDQFGARMLDGADGEWADKATFVSSAPGVASVSSGGLVTAIAPGSAEISISLTVANHTVTSSRPAEVVLPTATSVTVTAGQDGSWSPTTVYLKAGGTVTWVVPSGVTVGTIWMNVWDPNAEKLEFVNGVATRTFPTPGIFYYGTGGGLMWSEEGGAIRVF